MIGDILFKIIHRFDFIKKNKLFIFIKTILVPFFFKLISRFFKDDIDENLIIIGAYGGGAYLDNTKYLFEFLNRKTTYEVIWIAKLSNVYNELEKKGYHVLPFYSIRTIRQLRRAKYIFLSHGYGDVLNVNFSPKTTIILTWHGTPIKKINTDLANTLIYKNWGNIFRLNLQFDQYIDYLLTPAGEDYEHKVLKEAFKIPQKKILDLGYPRNDILFNIDDNFIKTLKHFHQIPDGTQKIFLYAPTFREDLTLRFPLSKDELFNLNQLLIKKNSLFLIKAHLFEQKINFKEYTNIRLIDKSADIQELLIFTDILITDYSSVIFDFLLTMKPILLFTYDLDEYKKSRGMYYEFKRIAPGPLLFNAEDLINAIKNIDEIDLKYKEVRKKICNRFNKDIDGKSIERILNFLNIIYN